MVERGMKKEILFSRPLPGKQFLMPPEGAARIADYVSGSRPVSRPLKAFKKMVLFRSKDAGFGSASGACHVGRLGIELLSCNYDLVVCPSLGLVTGYNVTVAKVPEFGRYELAFSSLQGSISA